MSKIPDYVEAGQREATAAEGTEHKLTDAEWQSLVGGLGHTPSLLELGVVSALWSEHCSYKSSRRLLGQFLTEGPRVLQGPGENAGVVDLGDGWAVAFKMESHNHPSFIEPYQGAATGVGGIMRDVFTMGARPIASMNALRFGDPHDEKWGQKTKSLVHGVVAGIGGYGNCMGVPTVAGETYFHKSYNQNNLVNAFNLGLLRSDQIFLGTAEGVGNPVLYVGSKTGRDGIHGASMASDSFSEDDAQDNRPTVQAGDPFQEKKLLEACLELMQEDCIIGIQDMGAAGLTSSAFEMAERAGNGLRMDLDKVPTREPNMSPYELMLSESQERMLVVLEEGTEHIAERIFAKWGLDAVRIGEVIDGGTVALYWNNEQLCNIPIELATSGYATPERIEGTPPAYSDAVPQDVQDWPEFLVQWMSHPNRASKRWIWEQYDSTVQGATVWGPGAEAAVVSPPEIAPKGVAMTADCNSRYVATEPHAGGQHSVAGAVRNLACVGADAIGMTDCLNFGNPEKPDVYGTFAQAIKGVADAGKSIELPVVSGNVSLYNETDGKGVFPTPGLGVVGLVPEVRAKQRLLSAGDVLFVVGWHNPVWGGSEYGLADTGECIGPLPELDWDREMKAAQFVRDLVRDQAVLDAKDIGTGGLLTSTSQLVFRHGSLGFKAQVDFESPTLQWLGESAHSYVVAVAEDKVDALIARCEKAEIPVSKLAIVDPSVIELGQNTCPSTIDALAVFDGYNNGFKHWVQANA